MTLCALVGVDRIIQSMALGPGRSFMQGGAGRKIGIPVAREVRIMGSRGRLVSLVACASLLGGCVQTALVELTEVDEERAARTERPWVGDAPTMAITALRKPGEGSLEAMFPDSQVQALARAAGRGDLRKVEELAGQGVDVNAHGAKGVPPVAWPLRRGNIDGFRKLLELGADPNRVFNNGHCTVMAWAAWLKGDFLKLALEHGGDPNIVCPYDGSPPLFVALDARGSMEKVPLLFEWGADIDFSRGGWGTPVMWVAAHWYPSFKSTHSVWEKFKLILLLLQLGADAGFINQHGMSLAHYLSDFVSGRGARWINEDNAFLLRKIIDELAARGIEVPESVNPSVRTFAQGSTEVNAHLLFPDGQLRAALGARREELDQLVADGLDVNARGELGATLLVVTVPLRYGAVAQTATLLDLGADPNVIYDDGNTVMHRAAFSHDPAVWDLLLKFGGDPNLVNPRDGKTPLFKVIEYNPRNYRERLVRMLDSGADINHQALNGDTPVIAAAMLMDYQTVDLLLGRGADHRPANRVTGRTLMDWIAYHRHRGRLPSETVRWMEKAASRLERRGAQIPQWEAAEAERG